MYLALGVVLVVLFLIYVNNMHSEINSTAARIVKIYCDGKTFEIRKEQVYNAHEVLETAHGHLEELIESINRLIHFPDTFPSEKIFRAIKNFCTLPLTSKYIKKEHYLNKDHYLYNKIFDYGGAYLEFAHGHAIALVNGDPGAVLKLCHSHHDPEEIERVSKKWHLQGYKTLAIAVGDIEKHKKNILKRGVKDKMTFLGMFAISEK